MVSIKELLPIITGKMTGHKNNLIYTIQSTSLVLGLVLLSMPVVSSLQLTHVNLLNGEKCYYEHPEHAGSCYVVTGYPGDTWSSAYMACTNAGGRLLGKPSSRVTDVTNQILFENNVTSVWLSMTKIITPWTSSGRYISRNQLDELWVPNEPAAPETGQDCVQLDVNAAYNLTTAHCHHSAGYVCMADESAPACREGAMMFTEIIYHKGSCYMFKDISRDLDASLTWFEVQQACASLELYKFNVNNGRVSIVPATIDNTEVQSLIRHASPGKTHDITRYWVGITRARWVLASGLIIDELMRGAHPTTSCVTMLATGGKAPTYMAKECHTKALHICEYDLVTVEKQTQTSTSKTTTRPMPATPTATPVSKTRTITTPKFRIMTTTINSTITTPTTTTTRQTRSPPGTSPTVMSTTTDIPTTKTSITKTTIPRIRTTATTDKHTTTTTNTTLPTLGKTKPTTPTTNKTIQLASNSTSTTTITTHTTTVLSTTYKPTRPTKSPGLISCEQPITISFIVTVTLSMTDSVKSRRIDMLLNNITTSVSTKVAIGCLDISVASLDQHDSIIMKPNSLPKVYVIFSNCDYVSLKKYENIDRQPYSYWLLVCLDRSQLATSDIQIVADEFNNVLIADEFNNINDVGESVAAMLLQTTTRLDVNVTVLPDVGKQDMTAANKLFVLMVALPSCVFATILIVVVIILVVKRTRQSKYKQREVTNQELSRSYGEISIDSSSISDGNDSCPEAKRQLDPISEGSEFDQSMTSFGQISAFMPNMGSLHADIQSTPLPEQKPSRRSLKEKLRDSEISSTTPKSNEKRNLNWAVSGPSSQSQHASDEQNYEETRDSSSGQLVEEFRFLRSMSAHGHAPSRHTLVDMRSSTRSNPSVWIDNGFDAEIPSHSFFIPVLSPSESEEKVSRGAKKDDIHFKRNRIKRSREGIVKIHPKRCASPVHLDNAPNTMFYNSWSVPYD